MAASEPDALLLAGEKRENFVGAGKCKKNGVCDWWLLSPHTRQKWNTIKEEIIRQFMIGYKLMMIRSITCHFGILVNIIKP